MSETATREAILERAAAMYEDGGLRLVQGEWGFVSAGTACVTEAVAHAAQECGYPFDRTGPNNCRCGACVQDDVCAILGIPSIFEAFQFNDAEGRTEVEVAAWLREKAVA